MQYANYFSMLRKNEREVDKTQFKIKASKSNHFSILPIILFLLDID